MFLLSTTPERRYGRADLSLAEELGRRAVLALGLYPVHRIVTSHGGSVRVESKPNAGARFIMELPLHPPALDAQDEPHDRGGI